MNTNPYKKMLSKLKKLDVVISSGLTNQEIIEIENYYQIYFPVDLKELFSVGLPISNSFYNWRDFSLKNIDTIRKALNWPLNGIIFDIEHNNFWYKEWGDKPKELNDCIDICKNNFVMYPALIPIYGHRYISSFPLEKNNPVFSVYQTDIIYYGENLESYFDVELRLKKWKDIDFTKVKTIPFWTDIIDNY